MLHSGHSWKLYFKHHSLAWSSPPFLWAARPTLYLQGGFLRNLRTIINSGPNRGGYLYFVGNYKRSDKIGVHCGGCEKNKWNWGNLLFTSYYIVEIWLEQLISYSTTCGWSFEPILYSFISHSWSIVCLLGWKFVVVAVNPTCTKYAACFNLKSNVQLRKMFVGPFSSLL